jgi:hypothetical protein
MKVRVIVATLGERKSLESCFESIKKQELSEIEVVIVTPLDSLGKVDQIAKHTLKSNYQIIEDANNGLSAAINQGFNATGDFKYFCWINDDDQFEAGSLQRSVLFMERNQDYSAVVGTLKYKFENSKKIIFNKVSKVSLLISEIGPNLIPQPGSLIRKDKIMNFLLNEKYNYAMDLDLFLRLKKNGKIGIIKEVQAILNYDLNTITLKNRKEASKEAFKIRKLNAKNTLFKLLNVIFYLPTVFLMYLVKSLIKS